MSDRRRINGPSVATSQPVYASLVKQPPKEEGLFRQRKPDQPRKIFLQTGLTPSISGSAYFELERSALDEVHSFSGSASSLKISCTVHGPKPLPRNAAFSPQLLLNTHVKYAPFASAQRGGFIRDGGERDLGAHLETALKGVVLGDRWPKSSVEIIITIIEGEAASSRDTGLGADATWGCMNVLAGCITTASAALVEAGVDCLDLVSGGTAATVSSSKRNAPQIVVDPNFAEHERIDAVCCVGYLTSRDELVELWMKGEVSQGLEAELVEKAVLAAQSSRNVLAEVLRENMVTKAAHEKQLQQGALTLPNNGLQAVA